MDSQRQNLNNKEVKKAKESLKRIANNIEDRCSVFYADLYIILSQIENALSVDYDADIQPYLDKFYTLLNTLIEDAIDFSYEEAVSREDEDKYKYMYLIPILMVDKNYKKASMIYRDALSQEIGFFKDNKGYPYDLKHYLKDPIAYISAHKWNISSFKNTVTKIKGGMNYIIEKVVKPIVLNISINTQNKTLQEIWKDKGIQMYQGFRNSDYYCPLCDELCATPHPITDMVFPAHPRCVCGIYYIEE